MTVILSNVRKREEISSKLCGLLRISELYVVYQWNGCCGVFCSLAGRNTYYAGVDDPNISNITISCEAFKVEFVYFMR